MIPTINSHNHWSKLEEVWLGDVYPSSWYNHLSSDVQDCFYIITEITKEDLNTIQKKLEEFGVTVRRPEYKDKDHYMQNGQLIKPQICPRDFFITVGNNLYADNFFLPAWQDTLAYYKQQPNCQVKPVLHRNKMFLSGASSVRVGKDLYFDLGRFQTDNANKNRVDVFKDTYLGEFEDYRLHLLFNGGHCDGCFSVLRPGLILASEYYKEYALSFPNWELLYLTDPDYKNQSQSGNTFILNYGMFNLLDNHNFLRHINIYAADWIGNFTETYFDINCLIIDEKNILMLGENEKLFKKLSEYGITVHSVPFRARTFWDAGLHCLTLDIKRQSSIIDYFPDRKDALTIYYDESLI